jgi:hypothetical protein
MHMDESKPPISPSEFRLRSASERASADIDPVSAELAKSAELGDRQSRPGQAEVRQNDPPDGPSVAVYSRNQEEVREGFLDHIGCQTASTLRKAGFDARYMAG